MKKLLLLLLFIPLVSFGQETINLNVNSESTLRKGRTADEIALAVKREEGMFNMGKGIYKIVKVGKWKSLKKLFERCENQIQIFTNNNNLNYKLINREDIKKGRLNSYTKVKVTYQVFNQDGSSVLTKEEAKKELIELKEYLDLGIITQEEFDKKAVSLKKILLGN